MKLRNILISSVVAVSATSLFASHDTDSKIEDAAKASYNYRTVLEDRVKVKANDGIVTLTGIVADSELKSIAEDTVSNLPGVTRVDNQITLDPAIKEHSDGWIAMKLRTQLLTRSNVSIASTKVDVKNGIVLLTGTADNMAQKELTELYAKEIEGVKSVRNELVIKETAMAQTKGDAIDDASITTQVKYALLSHKSTSALKTKVTTTNGVVVITGVAANDAEKTLVGKLATSIRGVKSVTNDMTVKG